MNVLVLLVGPKGSGKSHIGRLLEATLGVFFLEVEPLWVAYHEACKTAGREATIPGGIAAVHPAIREALRMHRHVCVETTGASAEILADLLSLAPAADRLVVRVSAPLELCLERIARRDPTHHLSVDDATIRKAYALSAAADVDAAIVLDNRTLSDADIVRRFEALLATG